MISALLFRFKSLYDYLRYGSNSSGASGYGTLYGVFLPGILTMFGVIIYLRLGWIIGSIGLLGTVAIMTLSCLIVFITVLSIASTVTNRKIEGGGTYYMVSRSLGIEIGSAVGVPLFIAQVMSVSFCAIGFAESIAPLLPGVPLNFIGIGALCTMMLLNFSTGVALNTQFLIFLIVVASLASFFLGKPVVFDETLVSGSSVANLGFWAAFAIFFPGATGIEAGVALSGQLHSPRKSLPLGTISVIITGYLIYLAMAFFLRSSASKEMLLGDPLITAHVAKIPILISVGVWAATLSSVLGGLLAAPRSLQALARDKVLPSFFSKEFGLTKEPRIASLFCFLLALMGIYYGSVNQIAPILTMFYLIAYAVLNLASALEEFMGNPSWRPTFRIPWYVSMGGFVLCIMAMFMIDSGSTFIAFSCVIAIYLYMSRRKIAGDWEDIWNGFLLFLSRFAIYKLSTRETPSRSWRPHFLVFSANPMKLSNMLNLTSAISKDRGFLTLTSVFSSSFADHERAERWKKIVSQTLVEKGIQALVEFRIDENFFLGVKRILTHYGIGPITPNIVVLGELQNESVLEDFLKVLELAQNTHKSVIILREKNLVDLQPKKIDIWWDDSSRSNSELMLVLAHMLSSKRGAGKICVTLKSVVPDEQGRAQRQEYFESFLAERRFVLNTEIYVGQKDLESFYRTVSLFSEEADLVLLGLKPISEELSFEEYTQYYLRVKEFSKDLPSVAFVMSSNQLNLTGIFK